MIKLTRTETLSLPSWEEFTEIKSLIKFIGNNGDTYNLQFMYSSNAVFIYDINGHGYNKTYRATKENYIECCRLAKKLFMGEE